MNIYQDAFCRDCYHFCFQGEKGVDSYCILSGEIHEFRKVLPTQRANNCPAYDQIQALRTP